MSEVEPPVLNLSANKENAELTDQKPFIIRGHHLISFYLLKNSTPERQAGGARRAFAGLWRTAKENPNDPKAQRHIEYVQDLLGLSLESADEFENRTRRVFETFLMLPDNHPAEIVEGIPDEMCNACAIGEHCKRLTNNPLGKGKVINMLERDRRYSEKFIRILNNLNLPKPTIAQEQVYFSDAEPHEVRRIQTTIDIVKHVLREKNLSFWALEA